MRKERARDFPSHWRQSRGLPDAIARELNAFADEIRGDQRNLPILLRTICARLDIRVVRRKSVAEGKAYLEWDRGAGSPPLVLLPQVGTLTWDRFCTAHELGHYVLISRYGWHPLERSDYWRTEVMCDHFARQLLIPDAALRKRAAVKGRSAMLWCNSVARRADVPWIQAGKKITSIHPHLGFFRLAKGKDARLKVMATSLPMEKGRGILVSTRTKFSQFAFEAMDIAQRESLKEARILSRTDFLGSTLGELFSDLGVKEIFAEASATVGQVKIAITR